MALQDSSADSHCPISTQKPSYKGMQNEQEIFCTCQTLCDWTTVIKDLHNLCVSSPRALQSVAAWKPSHHETFISCHIKKNGRRRDSVDSCPHDDSSIDGLPCGWYVQLPWSIWWAGLVPCRWLMPPFLFNLTDATGVDLEGANVPPGWGGSMLMYSRTTSGSSTEPGGKQWSCVPATYRQSNTPL